MGAGMAVKLMELKGTLYCPLHGSLTQDFVMVNQPAFAFANVEDYELLSKVLLDTFWRTGFRTPLFP